MTGDVALPFEDLEEEAERRLQEELRDDHDDEEPEAAGSFEDQILARFEALEERDRRREEELAELRAENRTLREIIGALDMEIPALLEYEEETKERGKWSECLEVISTRQRGAMRSGLWVEDHRGELEKLLDGPDPGDITEERIAHLLRTLNTPEKPVLERRRICEVWGLSSRQEKRLFKHLTKTGWFVLKQRDLRKRAGRGNPQILTLTDEGRAEARRRS